MFFFLRPVCPGDSNALSGALGSLEQSINSSAAANTTVGVLPQYMANDTTPSQLSLTILGGSGGNSTTTTTKDEAYAQAQLLQAALAEVTRVDASQTCSVCAGPASSGSSGRGDLLVMCHGSTPCCHVSTAMPGTVAFKVR